MHRAATTSDEYERPTVVCAWCSVLLSRGGDFLSHGICTTCSQELMAQLTEVAPAVLPVRTALVGAHA